MAGGNYWNRWTFPVVAVFGVSLASGWLVNDGQVANAGILLAAAGFLSVSIIRARAAEDVARARVESLKKAMVPVFTKGGPWCAN